jgi:tRNA1Val (adenine37-N6)-methyltransferase
MSSFRFKQFTIHQDRCAMKVGTDGVLLGAWADCVHAARILDIGTGTGLIALMLAQRSRAVIDAIEIDEAAARQATENVLQSPFADRISVSLISFQEFYQKNNLKYDLIVSNPPYFNRSLKPPAENRTTARHTDTLPFEALINGVKNLLADSGHFALILPTAEGEEFIVLAEKADLFCVKKVSVYPREDGVVKRLLLLFSAKKSDCKLSDLVIETAGRHIYSEEYKNLTKDFYLDKSE